ncbi:hypothetical protein B0H14DRAFT_2560381 [Mycena olivaceomarginata]|nr:hypothetical protein B0H14DRAFT_2560381 [Mycena olivaceomarginata]
MVFHYLPPIQADPPDDPVIYQNTYAETPTGADPVQVRIGPIFFHYLHLFQAAPPDDLPVDQRTDAEMLTRADPVQVGFETITVAIEVFAILLQIARIIEPILQDPRATALRAMNGDNPSRTECRELWKMISRGTKKAERKLREYRKASPFQSTVSKISVLIKLVHQERSTQNRWDPALHPDTLLDTCIYFWSRLRMQSMAYIEGRFQTWIMRPTPDSVFYSGVLLVRGEQGDRTWGAV